RVAGMPLINRDRERETHKPKQAPSSELSVQSLTQGSNPQTVLADTKELVSSKVSGAREAVAKDTVATRVTEAVDVTRGAVRTGVDATKSVVASGVQSVMGSRVGQVVLSGVDTMLGKSEEWMDNHLPMTDAELGETTLWASLRTPASPGMRALARGWRRPLPLSLSPPLLQMETVKHGVDQKLLDGQEKLHQMWLSWSQKELRGTEENPAKPEQVESQTLTMFRDIAQQLQNTCASLGSSIQGLPSHRKDQGQEQARRQVEGLQATFSGVHSFQDLSSTILTQSREQVAKAREALDHMVEYVAQNTPIMWLVGPFAPGVAEKAPEEKK
uniref:Perilipin n=1 Tax=Panthera tigris altaica TaxID=74533 RepID=A0A8C9M332_PANTA